MEPKKKQEERIKDKEFLLTDKDAMLYAYLVLFCGIKYIIYGDCP